MALFIDIQLDWDNDARVVTLRVTERVLYG